MATYFKDNINSWHLKSDGTYEKEVSKSKPFSAFQYLLNKPSLSGRGSKQKNNDKKI